MTNIALTGLARDLARRAAEGRPVRVGVIGSGEMGTDLVTQGMLMPGISIAAISTRRPHTAREAVRIAYGDEAMAVEAATASKVTRAIEDGRIAITSNEMLVTNPLIDVIIDATGKPGVAADFDLMAMEHGKHLVMMNVEADVTIGCYLKQQADRLGVVYSVGAGDEPSSCMELIEFASALGLSIVAAGKGKNNPLNHDAVPDDYREEAARRNMNPRMLVEFVDGSKTMVEMCAIANATGLVPDIPGMHGPRANRDQLAKVLIPKADGGLLSRKGVVDYTIGKGVAPGVFVIVEAIHPRVVERMDDLHVGKGPYYGLFRPYHLTSLEVPLTAARIMLYGKPDMVPLPRPVAEVCAVAKRDLAAGETFDAIGETCYRSWTMTVGDARASRAVPVGLLEGGKVLKPVKKGELLTEDNAAPDRTTRLYALRRLQDDMLHGAKIASPALSG
ncbi:MULTISPECIES: NAD(P)H-dependent oxidoreductase [unclassified Mesorhizobium]|uniref:NAD(P)H-dependent oxidoreductase n=1 Tax=unclassified Mesorhizobium TaxID=325217 RepID=UPI000F75FFC1|nr:MULTISPECIES: NAD(P)H-dependent oxidoreductase [unclassified Mesorhizobium]AZO05635.1 homoserine dehydrogenase [Mesorhizobium sp. M2A.F.Ca.ET.043.02.1.1]RUW38931.1 homoserine dehydrogenase [Mesorhizobium sp. M2A.F.Ca.ET.015.02.1.1]RVC95491.1 homoserine dehydrogenase [Mesorhizobium sp. M2A.F.Ca.ET.017.03.2.1]RVD11413.1 homoserine dehydrogenase [Mesorhizobium sp. M2A.F.Ca.ET.029.05.1.1]RWB49039.1 MAG: homoserine dehydrogenase [Mesorhizobium sp.]